MAVMLIARFDGDVGALTQAYDIAHAAILSRGGATGMGGNPLEVGGIRSSIVKNAVSP